MERGAWVHTSSEATADAARTLLDTDRVVVLDGDTLARSTLSRRHWPTHAPVVAVSFRGQTPKLGPDMRRNLKSIARFAVAKRST